MGWKTNSVFIRPAAMPEDPRLFFAGLGFRGLTPLGVRSYDEICGLRSRAVWIGRAGDCLILSGQELAEPFFEPAPSEAMAKLFALFPAAEIGAVVLESAVNGWGFAVFSNGRLLRRRCGDSEAGTSPDEGDPLPEEAELLSRSRLVDGRRVYRLPDFPGEDFEEDQVGEDFVSAIYVHFTGTSLLTDEALGHVPMQGFDPAPSWKFWAT